MALRSVITPTEWIDQRALAAGGTVRAASWDEIADDQDFLLTHPQLIVSTTWRSVSQSPGAFTEVARWITNSKDVCDVAGVTNNEFSHNWYVRAEGNTLLDTFEFRLTSTAVASGSIVVPTGALGTTAPAWYSGTINVKTNGIEDTLILSTRRTGGAGVLLVNAFMLVAAPAFP